MPVNPNWFPSLDSGMIAQLPLRLEILNRTRSTRFPDGTLMAANAEAILRYAWTLRYENLSDAEWQRFQDFIAATQRGAKSFAFADPTGNLLAQSTDLEGPAWVAPAGLEVDPIADTGKPNSFILTNSMPVPLALTQSVPLVGGFQTCFSVYAKWEGNMRFALRLSDNTAMAASAEDAGDWSRHSVTLSSPVESTSREVAIVVPPTTQLIIAAPQLEIAAQPGAYLETGLRGCVYPAAWLKQQSFDTRSAAPGAHSMTLRIESFRNV